MRPNSGSGGASGTCSKADADILDEERWPVIETMRAVGDVVEELGGNGGFGEGISMGGVQGPLLQCRR
jgi:hypothetical protein